MPETTRTRARPARAADHEEIARRYRAGETAEAIARSLEVSKQTVYNRLAAAGASRRLRPLPIPPEELARRYEAGESSYALAAALGVTSPTVRKHLRAARVALRPPGRLDDGVAARLLEFLAAYLLERGYQPSTREIQSALGFASPNSVSLHLNHLSRRGYIRVAAGRSRAVGLVRWPDGRPFRGLAPREQEES